MKRLVQPDHLIGFLSPNPALDRAIEDTACLAKVLLERQGYRLSVTELRQRLWKALERPCSGTFDNPDSKP